MTAHSVPDHRFTGCLITKTSSFHDKLCKLMNSQLFLFSVSVTVSQKTYLWRKQWVKNIGLNYKVNMPGSWYMVQLSVRGNKQIYYICINNLQCLFYHFGKSEFLREKIAYRYFKSKSKRVKHFSLWFYGYKYLL